MEKGWAGTGGGGGGVGLVFSETCSSFIFPIVLEFRDTEEVKHRKAHLFIKWCMSILRDEQIRPSLFSGV